jgi:hypothetical protein
MCASRGCEAIPCSGVARVQTRGGGRPGADRNAAAGSAAPNWSLSLASGAAFAPRAAPGPWRMARTAAHLVDIVIPHVPVRQWMLSLPIHLRLLLAAQPTRVTHVLHVLHRMITRHPLKQAGIKADEADSGATRAMSEVGLRAVGAQAAKPRRDGPRLLYLATGRWGCDSSVAGTTGCGRDRQRRTTAAWIHCVRHRPEQFAPNAKLQPPPNARSRAKLSLSWPGHGASAGHGCASTSSTSTCSNARTAAPGTARSSRPSWSGR